MYDLRKSYNREFYRQLVRGKFKLWFGLIRISLIRFLFYLAYKIDADLCKEITGKEYK